MISMETNSTRYPIIDYKSASSEVQYIYDDAMQTLQLPFVLNWFKCQGSNPTLLKGNWAKLKNTLMEGEVPNVLKQLIIYNVSKLRGCQYCAHAHGVFADSMASMLSEDPEFKPTENMDSPHIPSSYKAAISVVTKAALHPQQIEEVDFKKLQNAGFSPAEIQELMAQADLVNMLNTIADISGIKVDNELMEAEM